MAWNCDASAAVCVVASHTLISSLRCNQHALFRGDYKLPFVASSMLLYNFNLKYSTTTFWAIARSQSSHVCMLAFSLGLGISVGSAPVPGPGPSFGLGLVQVSCPWNLGAPAGPK